MACGDAYTLRYDEVLNHTPRNIKYVDDNTLWDEELDDCWWPMTEYLELMVINGVVVNPEKSIFPKNGLTYCVYHYLIWNKTTGEIHQSYKEFSYFQVH